MTPIPESLQNAIASAEAARAKYDELEAKAAEIGAILPTLRTAMRKAEDDVHTLRDEYTNGGGVPEALDRAQTSIETAAAIQVVQAPLVAELALKSAQLSQAAVKSVDDIQTFRDEYEH